MHMQAKVTPPPLTLALSFPLSNYIRVLGVMLLAGIIDNVLIGHHKIDEVVKSNYKTYCDQLNEASLPLLEKLCFAARKKFLFPTK